ncbi:MAG: ABC transporter permease [Nitrososphaerota archaeon]|nr:ABC transporter permease [Nitrososphaerota archaeon]
MSDAKRPMLTGVLKSAVPSLVALALGLLVASAVMLAFGEDPVGIFSALFRGALTTQFGQSSVLNYMYSYILLALAFLLPGKAGIWNIGGQGQAILGGVAAALLVEFVALPPVVWPLAAIVVAILTGAAWAAICGLLEAYRNASAIVTTIMTNFIAANLATFILYYVLIPKAHVPSFYNEVDFPAGATLLTLPYFTTSIMIIVAVLVAVGTAFFLSRTTLGYKIRATGLGSRPAESKGINPRTTKVIAMIIGGGIAGLAGAGAVMSVGHGCGTVACYQDGFASGWFGGFGFAGIAVALVAVNDPLASIFSAVFFSILAAGMPFAYQNIYIVWAMQGIIIIFMAAPELSRMILTQRGKRKWT